MRFSSIIIAYFLIGAVMWGGGALDWDEAGVAGVFIEDPQSGEINDETATALNNMGGPITQVVGQTIGGGLIATWNVLVKFIGYVFWPTTAMLSINAPMKIVVLATVFPVAFVASVLRLVRGSA